MDIKNEKEPKSILDIINDGVDTGTTSIVVGGGFGLYGTSLFAATGTICPACLIATPLLLSVGVVQRHFFLKNKTKENEQKNDTPTEKM